MNDLVSQKIVQVADSIQSTLIAKTPVALNLILETTRLKALSNLILSGLGFLIIAVFIFICFKAYKYDEDLGMGLIIVLGTVGFFILIISSIYFFDIVNWIGIWHPDIYIANELLQRVIR